MSLQLTKKRLHTCRAYLDTVMEPIVGLTREGLIELLLEMDRLLLSDKCWTQEVGARDIDGKPVDPVSQDAVCWCLQGAAWKVTQNQEHYTQVAMSLREAINLPQITIGEYNDDTDFPTIKQLLHKAREIAKKNEPWTATLPDRLK